MALEIWRQDLRRLREMAGRPGFWPRFAFLLVLLAPIYATLTSMVYWSPFFGINPSTEAGRALPIAAVVVLTALLLTLMWLDFRAPRAPAKVGLLGSAAGFFATGCSICQPIWLVWLGLGQASLFLIDLGVWISLASVAMLLYALHVKLDESCRV